MAPVRWQPFRGIEDIQREMNRLFDNMLTPASRHDGVGLAFTPAAELEETADHYQSKLEVPGASQFCKSALIPQPLLPKWEKGSRSQSPSPALGEGFRVRAAKLGCTRSSWNGTRRY